VTVKNPSSHVRRISRAQLYVTYTMPGRAAGLARQVQIVSTGGFNTGTLVAGGANAHFHPVVKVSLPCNVDTASLGAGYRLGAFRSHSQKGFKGPVAPLPVGTVGVVGLAMILGLVLAMSQLRKR